MIKSFKHGLAEGLFHALTTKATRRFPAELRGIATRKLQYLNVAESLKDLRSPPGNRLEALKGSRGGYHSIRINDQWRIVFRWDDGAEQVEVVDYHRG